jgi:quercetin 2,3-dioxygenase
VHKFIDASNDEEVRFLQLWFSPNEKKLTPSYEDISCDVEQLENNLLPVISHTAYERVAGIHQDLTLYLQLDGNKKQKDLHLYY